jgi:hypothetical protein
MHYYDCRLLPGRWNGHFDVATVRLFLTLKGKAVTDQDNDLLSLTILDRSSTASPTILPSQMLCCSGKGHWSILSNAYASGRRRLEWI